MYIGKLDRHGYILAELVLISSRHWSRHDSLLKYSTLLFKSEYTMVYLLALLL